MISLVAFQNCIVLRLLADDRGTQLAAGGKLKVYVAREFDILDLVLFNFAIA